MNCGAMRFDVIHGLDVADDGVLHLRILFECFNAGQRLDIAASAVNSFGNVPKVNLRRAPGAS
jgi:hypothetical protein